MPESGSSPQMMRFSKNSSYWQVGGFVCRQLENARAQWFINEPGKCPTTPRWWVGKTRCAPVLDFRGDERHFSPIENESFAVYVASAEPIIGISRGISLQDVRISRRAVCLHSWVCQKFDSVLPNVFPRLFPDPSVRIFIFHMAYAFHYNKGKVNAHTFRVSAEWIRIRVSLFLCASFVACLIYILSAHLGWHDCQLFLCSFVEPNANICARIYSCIAKSEHSCSCENVGRSSELKENENERATDRELEEESSSDIAQMIETTTNGPDNTRGWINAGSE